MSFFNGSVEAAIERANEGGLVVFPSGPGMACDLTTQPAYREALMTADLAITDSALMVLAHNHQSDRKLSRISGLQFLRALLSGPWLRKPGESFWIMPSESERDRNLAFLQKEGIDVSFDDTYVAPMYGAGKLADFKLLSTLRARRPKWIILGIGGGVQERLGLFLREALGEDCSILCLGAAIAFLSGNQAGIPSWADRIGCGWLFRCLSRPSIFVPRYWRSRMLPFLVWRHGRDLPPLAANDAVGDSPMAPEVSV